MTAPSAPSARSLSLATLAALAVALLVLVLFVLPAEYGVDPTGVGALTGVLREEEPSGGEEVPVDVAPQVSFATFASSFLVASEKLFEGEGYLGEGETVLVPFDVSQANVSRVTLRLEFVDRNMTPAGQPTRPDTFEIELKAPHGDVTGGVLARSEAASGGGRGEAVFVVRQPPFPREVESESLASARAAFERNDPPDATAAGEWLARVTMVEAGDGDAQGVPLAAGPAADAGNSWKISVHVETYALAVAEKPGSRQRSDAVTLGLGPRAEMEYKLAVGFGKRVDWSWSTGGTVVYVDFHGEKTGDASGAFTRHKSGDFAEDSGTLVAPFDGRHGWFWRNPTDSAVAITLSTRGLYEVIGRV